LNNLEEGWRYSNKLIDPPGWK